LFSPEFQVRAPSRDSPPDHRLFPAILSSPAGCTVAICAALNRQKIKPAGQTCRKRPLAAASGNFDQPV